MDKIETHTYEDQSDEAEPAVKRLRLSEAPNEPDGDDFEELVLEDILAVPSPSPRVDWESDKVESVAERLQLDGVPSEANDDNFDELRIEDIIIKPSLSLDAGCVAPDEIVCFGTVIQHFSSSVQLSNISRSVASQPHMNTAVQANFHLCFLLN